ncbi:MAG: hypothetical protein ABI678_03155, partial [Kofleriaceae bacterium]
EMQSLQAQALQAQTAIAPAPYDGTVDYSGACMGGGSISVTGAYSGDDGSTSNATFDQAMTLDNCVTGTMTVDGDWHWTGNVSATGEEFAIDADITVTDPAYSTHFVYDVTMSFSVDGHYSISGSMTIGGVHYDADFSYPN